MPTGGQAPVSVGCTPEPGHGFGIGTTEVSCSASDALQQTASCTFAVTVLGPPKLSATRFLAFGDSLTSGWVSPPTGRARPEPTSAYPHRLQQDLRSRYLTQMIEVINAGAPGEEARDAVSRFRSLVGGQRPEVVLLMQGTNDLDVAGGGGAQGAAAALNTMVQYAQSTGADVLLMTIPPQVHTASAQLVEPFNTMVREVAARRGATLVDIYTLVRDGACSGDSTTPCIGADGLHPTADGYRLIAEELSELIRELYDVEITPQGAGAGARGAGSAVGIDLSTHVLTPTGRKEGYLTWGVQ